MYSMYVAHDNKCSGKLYRSMTKQHIPSPLISWGKPTTADSETSLHATKADSISAVPDLSKYNCLYLCVWFDANIIRKNSIIDLKMHNYVCMYSCMYICMFACNKNCSTQLPLTQSMSGWINDVVHSTLNAQFPKSKYTSHEHIIQTPYPWSNSIHLCPFCSRHQ